MLFDNEKETFWDKVTSPYWWCYRTYRDVYHRVKRLPHFLSKWWVWTKLLWNDWDFDYLCLLPIIALKTKRTREYLVKENLVEVDERTMKEVEQLALRIWKDDYCSKEWDEFHKKYPIRWSRIVECDKPALTRLEQSGSDELMRLTKKQEELMEADMDRLFELIRKHMRTWWS